jgi:hypothetical protein
MMTRWRTRLAAMTVLVLPACIVLSCGDTEHSGDTTVGTQGGASEAGAADGGAPVQGGTEGVAGGGRGGSTGAAGFGFGGLPMLPGVSDMPKTITCGKQMCGSVSTLSPTVFVDPCCAGDGCGVSTELMSSIGFQGVPACEAQHQAGALDASCPTSAPQMLPANGLPLSVAGFAGCCRAETGTCGVVVDDLAIAGLGLPLASPKFGCVDSAPFFGGKPAASCGPGAGGASNGGAPNGGAPAEGGAGGAPSAGAGGG